MKMDKQTFYNSFQWSRNIKIRMDNSQTFYNTLENINNSLLFTIFTISQGILQHNKDGQTKFLQHFPVAREYNNTIRMDRQILYHWSGNITAK